MTKKASSGQDCGLGVKASWVLRWSTWARRSLLSRSSAKRLASSRHWEITLSWPLAGRIWEVSSREANCYASALMKALDEPLSTIVDACGKRGKQAAGIQQQVEQVSTASSTF